MSFKPADPLNTNPDNDQFQKEKNPKNYGRGKVNQKADGGVYMVGDYIAIAGSGLSLIIRLAANFNYLLLNDDQNIICICCKRDKLTDV